MQTFWEINLLSSSFDVWQQIIFSVVSKNWVFLLSKMKDFCDVCYMKTQYYTPCAISNSFSTIHTDVNMWPTTLMNRWRGASSSVLNFDLAVFLLRTKLVVLIFIAFYFKLLQINLNKKIYNSCLNSLKVIAAMRQHREWKNVFVQYWLAIL